MPRVTIAGDEILYAQHKGDLKGGRDLILIHGAGGSHLHWPIGLRRLEGATVYAPDLPGNGRSEGTGHQTISAYRDFVLAFMDALDLEKPTLMGHSMGGAVAQDFALTYPHRLDGLILVGTGARLRVAPAILDGIHQDFEGAVRLICNYAYAPDAPAQLKRLGVQRMAETRPDVLYGNFLACDIFDVIDRLGEITAPTLIICGTADRLTPPKYSTFLRDRIPGAQLVLIEGGGHMVALEQPQAVIQAVTRFLQR